ncbi:hypothetical protein FA15DRAFT_660328 [Coprinopsis marcescibilis]|uniref:DDE-1 domain-containing protein n=1 Tax=Coprinopsis marcescibilis TaxID=230819 RepID=A0A5C3KGI6_COPMA|nr:hypothetical protein FA15DRAFT_660328 [Coprinopsis marcescibilis]
MRRKWMRYNPKEIIQAHLAASKAALVEVVVRYPATSMADKEKNQGTSQELDTRLRRLSALLDSLPLSLPVLAPGEAYGFGLDPGDIEDEGLIYALNRNLEMAFGHTRTDISALTNGDQRDNPDGHLRRWLERIIKASELAGAKVVTKIPKRRLMESSDEEDNPPVRAAKRKQAAESSAIVISSHDDEIELEHSCAPKTTQQGRIHNPPSAEPKLQARQRTLFEFGAKPVTSQELSAQMEHAGSGVIMSSLARDLPTLSRPNATWKNNRTGKNQGVVQAKHKRINWFNPLLWTSIARIALRVGCRLGKAVVARWISKTKRRWSKKTLAKAEQGASLKGTGRAGVLANYPEIVEEFKTKLLGLRSDGLTVDRLLGCSIMLALVKSRQPHLLETFKCSEQYIGQFFESVLNWSLRRGTRQAAKLPDNASDLTERTFFRIVHLVDLYDIPPGLIINMDQTGIILVMSSKRTFETKNSRQVDIAHHDEKRAYTLCVTTTTAGDILPFQQVWSGKTKNSLPSMKSAGYTEAIESGFDFSFALSAKKTSHFSTIKTMKEPWIKKYIELHNLPADQKAIFLIDCYPVHIGQEFRTHVFEEYPNIFLSFIPASCLLRKHVLGTGIFQPADVGLNHVIKHFLRQHSLQYLVKCHEEQLDKGLTSDHIKQTMKIASLQDASVRPIIDLYKYLESYTGRKLIERAWEKSATKEWNLGAACITSKRTKAAYQRYLESDTTLRQEIQAKIGRDAMLQAQLSAEEDPEDMDIDGDSSEIPLSAVINSVEKDLDGTLVPTGAPELIWAYSVDGSAWMDSL